jgi:hypothetical protein
MKNALSPPGVDVDDCAARLRIGWRWFSRETVALTVFCIVWDVGTILSYALPHGAHSAPIVLQNIIRFLLVILAAGMTYGVLCGYFNRTSIVLDCFELVVRRGPLPCGGNRRLSGDNIQQLYYDRAYVRVTLLQPRPFGGYCFPPRLEFNKGWMYVLNARMSDGSVIQLIGLRRPELAEFLRFAFEQRLRNIRNAAQPGNAAIDG